jgi:geranylgeranyl pyrophosphate synthase
MRYALAGGGKRIRPVICLAAGEAAGADPEAVLPAAAALELVHNFSLVHDDVIDRSDARRGHQTVHTAFGNTLAVLTGDYLFGKSGELVAGLGSTGIMRVFSWAVMEVVQGEMLRPALDGNLEHTERDYLAKIRGKTAALLAMCAQTGAMLDAEDDQATIAPLRNYGMSLGMAFQIIDDVLDFTATEEQLGKPVGSDLRQGTITLPTIYFLRQQPRHEIVQALLARDETALDRAHEAVQAIRASGAVERALDRAREYAAAATAELETVPPGPATDALRRLARYVVERHE